MSILIIDKSIKDQEQIKFLLNIGGILDIIRTETFKEALQYLTPENNIDVIILDIFHQKQEGLKLCNLVKSTEQLKEIQLVVVSEPLEIEELLRLFEAGITDFISKPISEKYELIPRVASALKLKEEIERRKNKEQQLIEKTKELEIANNQLKVLASKDNLTGIANRRHFDNFFQHEWKRSIRTKTPVSILMIDIDFFKQYNDIYGHQPGDECLISFAGILKSCIRRSGDLLARYGGEEFVAVLPDTISEGAEVVAKSMQEKLNQEKIPHEGSKVSKFLTFSMGISTIIPQISGSPAALIEKADNALYKAKEAGRNCYKVL